MGKHKYLTKLTNANAVVAWKKCALKKLSKVSTGHLLLSRATDESHQRRARERRDKLRQRNLDEMINDYQVMQRKILEERNAAELTRRKLDLERQERENAERVEAERKRKEALEKEMIGWSKPPPSEADLWPEFTANPETQSSPAVSTPAPQSLDLT